MKLRDNCTTPLPGRRLLLLLPMLFCGVAALWAGDDDNARRPILTVLFTTEIHGRLLPCDCPIQPLGGVARRATRIERYRRRGPTLVLDAGGWQAGGAYDLDSDGDPQRDALRTDLMARAMTRMSYDVICGTQEDPLKEPYARPANGSVGMRLSEREFEVPLQLCADDPKACLWSRTPAAPVSGQATRAPLIVLSRLDENEITRQAATFPDEALVITPVASTAQRCMWKSGKATLVGFDYRSEALGVAEIYPSTEEGRQFEIRVNIDSLTDNVPENPDMNAILEPYHPILKNKSKRQIEMEYWTRPEEFAREPAWTDMLRAAGELSDRITLSLHFHLPEEILSARSLQNHPPWVEAGLYAVMQKYYPEKFPAWCVWRATHPDRPWEEGSRALGLLNARIRGALAVGEPAALLRADYRQMVRRGLDSAEARDDCELLKRRRVYGPPTLVIANRLYHRKIDYPTVMQTLCPSLEAPLPRACARWVSTAQSPSSTKPRVNVPAHVVVDEASIYDNRRMVMEALAEDLPGIQFQVTDLSTPEAQALIERAGVTCLPAYFIDPRAMDEAAFRNGSGALTRKDAGCLILDGRIRVGANRLLNRPRIKGRIDLFVSRSSEAGQKSLRTALESVRLNPEMSPDLAVHDVLYWDGAPEQRKWVAPGGAPALEEALRSMAVRHLAPTKQTLYLKERLHSDWEASVRYAGLDPMKIRALIESPIEEMLKALNAEADLLTSLGVSGDVSLLVENCELIPVYSPNDIARVFERTGPRSR